jgi:hypothetical protein
LKRYAERDNALRTLEEVGRIVGLTKQRVGQIEKRAMEKLARHPVLRELARAAGCPVPPLPPRRPPRRPRKVKVKAPAEAVAKTLFD